MIRACVKRAVFMPELASVAGMICDEHGHVVDRWHCCAQVALICSAVLRLWNKKHPLLPAALSCYAAIPIGHYLSPITNAVTACDLGDASNAIARPGSYQPSWLSPSDAAAGACLPCGSGVLSEPVSAELAAIIPPGGGVPLAKVAGPSSSCCEYWRWCVL